MFRKKLVYLEPILIFIIIILAGTILLTLPFCNKQPIQFENALFTAVSAVCVNGLSTVVISQQYTFLGQLVIAILSQIGALGFMSLMIFILTVKNKKINLLDTMITSDSINESVYGNVKHRVTNICKYTFIIETIGVILLAIRFVPMYGLGQGMWYSIFHSITAFCNVGFDLFNGNSLLYFKNDIYINLVFMMLIILGGIGFFVIEDVIFCRKKRSIKNLQLQSKIVIYTTLFLIVGGAIAVKILQPNLSILQSMFTSITLRTAGFTTANMSLFNPLTKLICTCMMFIGGAPGSTSGGIRIMVFAVIILSTIATLRDRKDVVVFSKKISQEQIRKAISIFVVSLSIILVASIAMYYLNDIGVLNILFQCTSAFSATGLEVVTTAEMNFAGKSIMMILMFIGRVTPLSVIGLFLVDRKEKRNIDYPEGKLML